MYVANEIRPQPRGEPIYEIYEDIPLDADTQIFMQQQCQDHHISYEFVLALMESESGFDKDAVGDGGNSIGYMQINRANWQRMADEYGLDVNNYTDNIQAGITILGELFDKYEDPYLVILCYKAGETGGAKLYKAEAFKSDTYDLEAICRQAADWEKIHEK